ncbi:MAG: hypothetical protein QM831_42815 [Kofleriaceae bacterium]
MNKKLVMGILAGVAGIASAQPETAESAQKRAESAMKAGRVHEACDAYAASDKLDPKIEVEVSLAKCYEQDGKIVSAAKLYKQLADKDGNASRRKTSAEKAAKLEKRAPKLRFAVAKTEGLEIWIDGMKSDSTDEAMVDVGPHDIVAKAPGFEGHASAPVDKEGQIVDVILRMKAVDKPAPAPEKPVMTAPPPAAEQPAAPVEEAKPMAAPAQPKDDGMAMESNDHRRRNGLIVGGVGVAALAAGVVFFELGQGKFDDEHKLCPNSMCANADDLSKANDLLDSGHLYRGLSYGMGIGGVALIGGGLYLLLTHHEESHVAITAANGGGGVAWTGHF